MVMYNKIYKSVFLLTLLLFFLSNYTNAQVIYNTKVDSVMNLVSLPSIKKFAKELSGDTVTMIGGSPYVIISRYWNSPFSSKAAQFIYERFIGFGLNARYQINNSTCVNVIATKTGTIYPNKQYIICAHYDDIITATTVPDTVPGADDNASGVSTVLEAARLLANINTPYTLVFIAFDKEETNGSGSVGYADSAYAHGDSIMGVLNLDMIAYDNNNDNKFIITTDSNSLRLSDNLVNFVQVYQLGLPYERHILGFGSDHTSFWDRQYKAISIFEDVYGEFNPYYHSKFDLVFTFNPTYFYNMAKTSIGLFSTWGTGFYANIDHTPIKSSYDTTSMIATAFINYPFALGTGANAPRLYYKLWNNSYNYVSPFSFRNNTFKFLIPGQSYGTKISYYLAVQDSAGSTIFTLPTGGSGINPPGTTAPPQQFPYYIWSKYIFQSNTVPKPISGSLTRDTIHIPQTGIVQDVNLILNLNHTNDGDLFISIAKVSGGTSTLCQYLGQGGQNFTNTVFDDSATISITQGTPPFTGRFIPQTLLSVFRGIELSGDWVLRIFDKGTGNSGSLLNWNMEITYCPTISIRKIEQIIPNNFSLEQNYPNPFNSSTKIKFSILNPNFTTIKIFDILGKEITTLVNEYLSNGNYETFWNAHNISSGIYIYKITSGEFVSSKKMLIIR